MDSEKPLAPYTQDKPYAFVSFSNLDDKEALPFIERLESDGDRVWFRAGEEPEPSLDKATERIKNCHCFIALISQEYFQSPQCVEELSLASELGKPIILVYLERTAVPAGMREIIKPLQSITKYQIKNENTLFKRLYRFKPLKECFDKEAKKAARQSEQKQPNPRDYINLRFLPSKERLMVKKLAKSYSPDTLFNWALEAAHEGDFISEELFFLAAAVQDDVESWIFLGMFYEKISDFEKALYWFTKAAETGEAQCMNEIGKIYSVQFQNHDAAEEWYLKAAEKGLNEAEYNLGLLYYTVYEDYSTAKEWYLKSANQGNIMAMQNLGHLYCDIFGEYKKAEEWWLKAADSNDVNAMFNLGKLYTNTMFDYPKAIMWYMRAAKRGDVDAMINVGAIFYAQKEYKKAERMWLKALKINPKDTDVLYDLGVLNSEALKDYDKAKKYYLLAAQLCDPYAMGNLSELYSTVFHNNAKSRKWSKQFKEAGFIGPIENYVSNYIHIR